jgi:uncharacterized protein (TIGR03435 family)
MGYTLIAVKPKMAPGDSSARAGCREGFATPTAADPRDRNPLLGRLLTCRNVSMAQLTYLLFHGMASGYVKSPVFDATGLEAGWDFTLQFSDASQVAGGTSSVPGAAAEAASMDSNGAVSLPAAMERQIGKRMQLQKRPAPVLVIDRLERTPTEN